VGPSSRVRAVSALLGTFVLAALLGSLPFGGVAAAATHARSARSVTKVLPRPGYPYNAFDSGMANSSIQIFNKSGELVIYGDNDVLYALPPSSLIPLGEELYQQNCQACHGVTADGVPPPGTPGVAFPNLRGLGPATYDFWIESGRMPATNTADVQPLRRKPRLDHLQALAISAYLNSLEPATPYIPEVNLNGANLSDGAALFALNCAACHTITGDGDALAYDTFAPSLRNIPATQVAEALRTGPANMPIFSGNLTDAQLRDVVAYVVRKIQHPQNPGGLGLGGLGPVGEGFIGLALGVGLLALVGFWVGDRT
jgi:ubiquinol-cytochrome c reductase cytochrome c subunit